MASDLIRFMHAFFSPSATRLRQEVWQPFVDIYRTADGWLVKFDLAGVRPEDVQVKVDGRYLCVRGTRRDLCVEEGCRQYSMEISYSQFERTVALPVSLEHARVRTEFRNGMLLVRIQREAA